MNIVFVLSVGIIILCIVTGAIRGFLKSSLSLAAFLLAGIVVSAVSPFVTGILRKNTGLDEWIADKVSLALDARIEAEITGSLGNGAVPENGMVTLDRDVTLPADAALPDGTVLPAGTRVPAGTALPAELFGQEQLKEQVNAGLTAAEQGKVIEMLPLPRSLKDTLAENNNSAVYEQFGVEGFTEYIGSYVGNVCLNIVGYILTFLIVFFALHMLMMAVNLVDHLPVVHGLNHFAGAFLGIFKGLLVLEVLFLILVPFSATALGESILTQVDNNGFLSALYHGNILMKLLTGMVGRVM